MFIVCLLFLLSSYLLLTLSKTVHLRAVHTFSVQSKKLASERIVREQWNSFHTNPPCTWKLNCIFGLMDSTIVNSTSSLKSSLTITQSFCMASKDLPWIVFMVLFCSFWSLKASVHNYYNWMGKKSTSTFFCVLLIREIHMLGK